MTTQTRLPESQLGPAEKLLDLVLSSSAHLWHNRPGLDVGGVWYPRKDQKRNRALARGTPVASGLFVPAATSLYSRLLEIYQLNVDLMAHFASYALKETEWRDLKVACAALMLVQQRSGQPVHDDDGTVAFYDDDYRRIGEAMLLHYEQKSTRMMTPKAVLRVAELLETSDVAELNRLAGFSDPAAKKPALGRWKGAATRWLRVREANRPMLEGLVAAGYKETIKKIRARPATSRRARPSIRSSAGSRSRLQAVTAAWASMVSCSRSASASTASRRSRSAKPSNRRSSSTKRSSVGYRRTWASRPPSWWRSCRACRTETSGS